jgi:hypothetical protein
MGIGDFIGSGLILWATLLPQCVALLSSHVAIPAEKQEYFCLSGCLSQKVVTATDHSSRIADHCLFQRGVGRAAAGPGVAWA